MLKKFFREHGLPILIYGGLIAMFVCGFILGMFGRSAPDAQTADFGPAVVSDVEATAPEEHTETHVKRMEAPTPEYTELTVTATAYCPCEKCCGKCDGITATGTKATAGRTIAVDPSIIPYGTEIIIAGNTYIAEDCGGAIKGKDRIDIFFDSHEEALKFGKQQIVAKVVRNNGVFKNK